jgi:hypothetical protein
MSQNLKDLLATAAEMRAVGHPWEAIAKEVNRKVKTCQNWPAKHKAHWDPLYHAVQLRRFESTSNECHTYLLASCRDKDPKVRNPALALWLKHGAKAYGPGGTMAPPAPPPPPPAEPTANERLAKQVTAEVVQVRARMDQERAAKGLPPATDEEFLRDWRAETMEWAEREWEFKRTGRYPGQLNPDEPHPDDDPNAKYDDDLPDSPPPAPPPPAPAPAAGSGNQLVVFGLLIVAAALVNNRPTYIPAPPGPDYVRGWAPDVNRNDPRLVLAGAEDRPGRPGKSPRPDRTSGHGRPATSYHNRMPRRPLPCPSHSTSWIPSPITRSPATRPGSASRTRIGTPTGCRPSRRR